MTDITTPKSMAPISSGRLQQIVDEAAILNLFVGQNELLTNQNGRAVESPLHQLKIELALPFQKTVKVRNLVSDTFGKFSSRCSPIEDNVQVRPGKRFNSIDLDESKSQRFVIDHCKISLGGMDVIECFGTGRTFPMLDDGKPYLAAAAVANIVASDGKLAGAVGNLTFCGMITDGAFSGHIIVRILDGERRLRNSQANQTNLCKHRLGTGFTFLSFVGQKGEGEDQANRFSIGKNRKPRGLNISTQLKEANTCFCVEPFAASSLDIGSVLGKEIGFGPLPNPNTPPDGLPSRPFPFEGVARYGFNAGSGKEIGSITTNILEGRRIDVQFAQAPNEPGFRFGFFGPIVAATGCFEGSGGILYGASASFLTPPPGRHVVTHFYAAMIADASKSFRAN